MSEKPIPDLRPVIYSATYSRMVPVARSHGYALALHGSLLTDLDVVAIPWAENASGDADLFFAFMIQCALTPVAGAMKAHGRRVWTLMAPGWDFGCYIDLSIMPLKPDGHD